MPKHSLSLYNTLTKQKEKLTPLKSGQIGLYVCGMTVYDYCHLGHARVWITFDILVRYLVESGYIINYVRNITDIDDKIIQRARDNQESIQTLTQRMISAMHEDMDALQLLPPSYEPRATEYIGEMIALTQTLIQKGYAYLTDSGDVYYSVKQFKGYGQLAPQALEERMSGARVAVDIHKKSPLDFVLWKHATDTHPVAWESPWGLGRPGWHLECSAMALRHLGASFDIHGGGADLQFPHHQNEMAQSEAATDQPFVRQWMHVGFVQINQAKMSKSAGNALSLQALRQQYPGELIRYFLLTSHYRSPLTYQEKHLESAQKGLRRLYEATRYAKKPTTTPPPMSITTHESKFHQALQDDLNTPIALATLFDIARDINRFGASEESAHLARLLKQLGKCLGLLQQDQYPNLTKHVIHDAGWIDEQIQARHIARQRKQWKRADAIRQSLLEKGIVLEDAPDGTHWRYQE
jgi:cysteinyl-tRNA synthetase